MPRLRRLTLWFYPITREYVEALTQLQSIESLSVRSNRFQDGMLGRLNEMKGLKELALLDFDPAANKQDAAMLASFARLEKLWIKLIPIVGDSDLACLRGLHNVVGVNLQDNDYHKMVFERFPPPDSVAIRYTSAFTGEGLAYLADMIRLEDLDLSNREELKDANFRYLAGLTSLRVLKLRKTGITGPELKHLVGMKNLEELDLSDNPVSNDGLACLAGLKNLRRLDLSDCRRINEDGLAYLRGLENLKWLRVNTDVVYYGSEGRGPPTRKAILDPDKVREVLSPIKGLHIVLFSEWEWRGFREGPPGPPAKETPPGKSSGEPAANKPTSRGTPN
jgi:Leucine-rich repeat (LRR) protein